MNEGAVTTQYYGHVTSSVHYPTGPLLDAGSPPTAVPIRYRHFAVTTRTDTSH